MQRVSTILVRQSFGTQCRRFSPLLSENQLNLREMAVQFAKSEIIPVAKKFDETGEYPKEVIRKLFDAGLLSVQIPEKYGGLGMSLLDATLITEGLSYGCSGIYLAAYGVSLPVASINQFGDEAQKAKYLGMVASEPSTASLAITEPSAGSDVAATKLKAVRDGDHYVLSGTKMWITGAGHARFFVTLARTDADPKAPASKAFTMFVVDAGTPGLEIGKKEWNMGQRASDTRMVTFDEVRVPASAALGGVGNGFRVAMGTFDHTRPMVAGLGCGITWRALEESLKYSLERKTFGVKIAQHQAVQQMLSQMTLSMEIMRTMTYKAAHLVDIEHPNSSYHSSVIKYYAAEETQKNAYMAVQIFGGAGFNTEYPVEKLMRDARILPIYEGTSQIQLMIIARNMIQNFALKGTANID